MKTRIALLLAVSSALSVSAFANDAMTCFTKRAVSGQTEMRTLSMEWGKPVSIESGEEIIMRSIRVGIDAYDEFIELSDHGAVIEAKESGYLPATKEYYGGYFAKYKDLEVSCYLNK